MAFSYLDPWEQISAKYKSNYYSLYLKDAYENIIRKMAAKLHWRHNERDGVSNHQPNDCLLNRLFSLRSKKTSKLRITGLCAGNSPVTSEFPAQKVSNTENVSIWWRHHDLSYR